MELFLPQQVTVTGLNGLLSWTRERLPREVTQRKH
jgi:hypothetical protein